MGPYICAHELRGAVNDFNFDGVSSRLGLIRGKRPVTGEGNSVFTHYLFVRVPAGESPGSVVNTDRLVGRLTLVYYSNSDKIFTVVAGGCGHIGARQHFPVSAGYELVSNAILRFFIIRNIIVVGVGSKGDVDAAVGLNISEGVAGEIKTAGAVIFVCGGVVDGERIHRKAVTGEEGERLIGAGGNGDLAHGADAAVFSGAGGDYKISIATLMQPYLNNHVGDNSEFQLINADVDLFLLAIERAEQCDACDLVCGYAGVFILGVEGGCICIVVIYVKIAYSIVLFPTVRDIAGIGSLFVLPVYTDTVYRNSLSGGGAEFGSCVCVQLRVGIHDVIGRAAADADLAGIDVNIGIDNSVGGKFAAAAVVGVKLPAYEDIVSGIRVCRHLIADGAAFFNGDHGVSGPMQIIALLCPEGDKVCFISLSEGELVNMRAGSDVVRCQIIAVNLYSSAVCQINGQRFYAVGLDLR